ncbi:MAG: hypothetical protein L6Q95_16895 [Planctomycetes bacterium]|nr:hypothetical protein [Planctomycetota bacterium]
MRNILALALLCVVGCGDGGSGGGGIGSHEEAADEVVRALKDAEGVLDDIKDTASAAAAKGKLEAIAKRLQGIAASAEKLGPPSDAAYGKTEPKMHQAIASFGAKTMAQFDLVMANPEIGKALGTSLAELQQQLPKLRVMLGG